MKIQPEVPGGSKVPIGPVVVVQQREPVSVDVNSLANILSPGDRVGRYTVTRVAIANWSLCVYASDPEGNTVRNAVAIRWPRSALWEQDAIRESWGLAPQGSGTLTDAMKQAAYLLRLWIEEQE